MPAPVPLEVFPTRDDQVAAFARETLGLSGIVDVHVHLLPDRLQEAVWGFFDRLEDPPWPITYREDETTRLATLRGLGVVAHTALAYGHKPGVAAWCNDHTLAAADRHPQIVPTFTFHAEDDAAEYVADAIARGGRAAKVHLQVGRFHATDPHLDDVWPQLAAARIPAVVHASAVYGVDGGGEYCGPDAIRALLDRHPDVTVVVAHLGAPDVEGFVTLAEQAPTLRLDTAMVLTDPPYLADVPEELLDRVRGLADRLLFGSDFPTIPHAYAAQVRGLARLELDRNALRGVFHHHAAHLLGLDDDATGEEGAT
ncbi:MAG: amidohydrolase family protein [Nitriliruptor sp.]|uniref:amidohydrolase family protein n=1 Tax=Nitriliruptor sp. TaxID=2448056 RepID=UPI0034A03083